MPLSEVSNTPAEPVECKTSSKPADDAKSQSLIFFDWDDTLLCSSFLWNLGLRLDSELDSSHDELMSQLHELELVVISVLKKAATYGKVHVITNAETGWVQRSAEKYIPGVMPFLDHVDIISARSTFESKFPDNPLQWKVSAFDSRLSVYNRDASNLHVISFGDSHVEREAVRTATRTMKEGTRTKSVKFAERPSMEQLRRQIELITTCFHYIHGHDGDLDLQLTVNTQTTNTEASAASEDATEEEQPGKPRGSASSSHGNDNVTSNINTNNSEIDSSSAAASVNAAPAVSTASVSSGSPQSCAQEHSASLSSSINSPVHAMDASS